VTLLATPAQHEHRTGSQTRAAATQERAPGARTGA